MKLEIHADSMDVSTDTLQRLDLVIHGVEDDQVLDQFDVNDILRHFDRDEFLDAIGKQAAMDYFDLQEAE